MTDVAEQAPETQAPEAEAEKPKPAVKQPKPCFCQAFEVRGETDDEVFATGCEQTTKSTFAQGHDARLVSFLVDGYFDKYTLHTVIDGVAQTYPTPEEAARRASDALGEKARKATENRRAKIVAKEQAAAEREKAKAAKKAEKEAAKNAPKATGAEVVAGSSEGDQPELGPDEALIKVGRFEYRAKVEGDEFVYTDGKGEVQRRTDGVKILKSGAPVTADA